MGYPTTFTGSISVNPPLTAEERDWIHSLREPFEEKAGVPGWLSPWHASDTGELFVPSDYDKPRQAPEWLVWIMQELDDPLFCDRESSGVGHHFSGRLTAQGAAAGDRYELRVDGEDVTVHRTGLPCWPCWWSTLLSVPPSVAYAFGHPDEAQDPDVDQEALDRAEPACLEGAWTPVESYRRVEWPPAFLGWWTAHVSERADAYWQLPQQVAP